MRLELDKILAPIVLEKGDPGPEHERLKKELDSWAIAGDFVFEYGRFPNGVRPDVLRGCKERGYLFVGDVKDSKKENPDIRESVRELKDIFGNSPNCWEWAITGAAPSPLRPIRENPPRNGLHASIF